MAFSYTSDKFCEIVGSGCCIWTICDLSSTRDTACSLVLLCLCTCLTFYLYCWSDAKPVPCIVCVLLWIKFRACKKWLVIKTSNTVRVIKLYLMFIHSESRGTSGCKKGCFAPYVTVYTCQQLCKTASQHCTALIKYSHDGTKRLMQTTSRNLLFDDLWTVPPVRKAMDNITTISVGFKP
jgi:hypothetical protein